MQEFGVAMEERANPMAVARSEEEAHYWWPVPEPENARHAFKGARRWDGSPSAVTVCGVTVAMAAVSETDWIFRRTCGHCWEILIREQEREPAGEKKTDS